MRLGIHHKVVSCNHFVPAIVTEQGSPFYVVPWCETQQLVLEGADLYLQHSNLGAAQSPPFPRDPALPMFPTRL